jgi:type 1 glutamine amidotransferase
MLVSSVAACTALSAESPTPLKKIVLIAGTKSHGPGDREYEKGVKLLKHCLDTSSNVNGVRTEVVLDGWPKNPATLEDADTILLYCDGSDREEKAHPFLREDRLQVIDRLMKRGVGFVALHYAVFIPVKKGGDQYLDWMGGFFDYETGDAPNHWFSKIVTRDYQVNLPTPNHPIARGTKPFSVREEYYFNMKFRENDRRLTPIASFGADDKDLASVVGYAVQRADGGRGFGYTGGHFHKNWQNENVRKLILNALLWTAKIEVPPGGVSSTLPVEEQAAQPAGKPTHTLIVTGHNHPAHNWRETTAALKEILAPAGFQMDVTESPDSLATTDLSSYQLLVLNYCNWERPGLSDAAKAKLVDYLSKGGGLTIIHFANGAFHFSLPNAAASDWPEYRKICRRVWDHAKGKSGHDPYGPFRVSITERQHPITQGMVTFETTDELYFNQQGELPIEPLATAHSKITGKDEPLALAYEYGQGRVFQTLLGHDAAAIRQAGELIRRGSVWAAGRESRRD